MAKIEYSKLAKMVEAKLKEKGISESEINEKIINQISENIKEIANQDYKTKTPEEETQKQPEEEGVVSVDISSNEDEMPQETPGEEPEVVTQTTSVSNEEIARKEGALEQKERELEEKERELDRKQEILQKRLEETEYEPEMPEALESIGPEKVFVFDMNKLSSGAELLSKLPMKLVDNPEMETTMKNLWLEKAKKKAEVFVVKFEKVGDITFNPIEGTSEIINVRDENPDNDLSTLQNDVEVEIKENPNNSRTEAEPGNMRDAIEPVKDVSKPMSGDMGLSINLNVNEMSLEDVIKQYLKQKEINNNNNA